MSSTSTSAETANPYSLQHVQTAIDSTPPVKRIHSGEDLGFFLTSTAYRDLKIWLSQLSRACLAQRHPDGRVERRELDTAIQYSPATTAVRQLLQALAALLDQAPPDTGPRRFGNVAFRQWMKLLTDNIDHILQEHLAEVIEVDRHNAFIELKAYLLESFGSAQRLDYGTGHELNFLAFLGGLWKIGIFAHTAQWDIVAGAINPYLDLVRLLIKTYTLEPAGSHGVWGLDDHSFIPYILGSAQLATALPPASTNVPFPPAPTEGSLDSAPEPASITSSATVNEQRSKNFYFAAIGFILDVKKGPFFEHSPYLYNISGIKDGWGKINKGMLKMYDAEVLGKLPVVQHFPFGQLWQWETDPAAVRVQATVHINNQPNLKPSDAGTTRAPWASTATQLPSANAPTRAPWAQRGTMPPPRVQRDR